MIQVLTPGYVDHPIFLNYLPKLGHLARTHNNTVEFRANDTEEREVIYIDDVRSRLHDQSCAGIRRNANIRDH